MIKRILATATAVGVLAGAVAANAQTKVRLTLDWVPQSTHGPHLSSRRRVESGRRLDPRQSRGELL